MFYRQHTVWFLGIVFCQIFILSCYDVERANPLDATAFDLFIPQIARPIGGEEMFPGIPQEIRWRPAAKVLDSAVSIQLVCEGDTTVIVGSTQNDGIYVWDVPDIPSPSCRIRIVGLGGASQSPGVFRIRKPPVEARIDMGITEVSFEEGPHHPTALRDFIVFTATRSGNTDLWHLDRRPDKGVRRLTTNPDFDGEAAWLKPNGTVIAYTSVDSTGRNVWIRATEGQFGPQTTRISLDGGQEPSWRNMLASNSYSNPALVYKKTDSGGLSTLITADLDFDMRALPLFNLPLSLTKRPTILPLQNNSTEAPVDNIYWFSDGSNNKLMYGGKNPARIYWIDFSGDIYESASNITFGVPPGLVPIHPAISPEGRFVAFSSQDDIWIAPIGGTVAWRVTLGSAIDENPDWATEDEIVFQRKETSGSRWQLWTVQRPDDVP